MRSVFPFRTKKNGFSKKGWKKGSQPQFCCFVEVTFGCRTTRSLVGGGGGGHQSVDGDLGFGLRTVGKPDCPLSVRSLMQDSGRSEGKYDTKGLGQFKKTKKGNMPRREIQSATSNGPFPREFGVIPKLPQKGCRRATQNKAPRLILQYTAGLR